MRMLNFIGGMMLCLFLVGCTCHFRDNDGDIDMYQELSLRNNYIQVGYFLWTGYTQKETINKEELNCNIRLGFPVWVNGMKPTTVNGLLFSPLLDYGISTVNGVACAPILMTQNINGIAFSPIFAGNLVVNGISIASINFHYAGNFGLLWGIINCRGLWADKGGIEKYKEIPRAFIHIGIINLDFCFGQYAQIGICNHSNGLPNIQLGVVNKSNKGGLDRFSLQIGLWNNNGKYSLPLVNMTW